METLIPTAEGGGNLALGSGSSTVEQEEAREDGGHEDSKIQAPASAGSDRLVASVPSSSGKDGCVGVEMAALPAEVMPKVLIDHEVKRQRRKHAASRSVDATNSLLSKQNPSIGNAPKPREKRKSPSIGNAPKPREKRKSPSTGNAPTPQEKRKSPSTGNASKPPAEKQRRKSSALHVQFSRSPLLNRMLVSPRTRHCGAKQLRSPSMISGMPSPTAMNKSTYQGSSSSICVPVVLDPRFKFNFLEFRLNVGFGDKGAIYAEKVKTTMKNLFSAYSPMLNDENNSQSRQNNEVADDGDDWADWEQHLTQQKRKKVKDELDVYYQDDLFPQQKRFDVLQWWMMHSTKYPIMSRIARDVFAAPASTVASEAAFSTTGRVVNEYRSRLTSKNIEALVCLQDWLRAEGHINFKIPDDILDGDE